MGAFARYDTAEVKRDLGKMLVLFPRLAERRTHSAGTLSGGEQQMLALEAAGRGYVMESGAITLAGDAAQLLADPRVREAYLGGEVG